MKGHATRKRRKVIEANRALAIATGIFMTISVLLAMQLVQPTTAHTNDYVNDGYCHNHMASYQNMMAGLSIEEMDVDNDGICDLCGMPVDHCEEMVEIEGFDHMGCHGD